MKLPLLCLALCLSLGANAQLEIAHMSAKGFSGICFGSFLNFAVPISDADALTLEGGLYYAGDGDNHMAVAPVIAGYRHTFDGTGTGFYVEPNIGYSFGGSDIQKTDAYGSPLTDASGNEIDQKVSGPSAGLSVGYIFPGFPINLGLRYEHIFANPDPGLSLISFRATYVIEFGHRQE